MNKKKLIEEKLEIEIRKILSEVIKKLFKEKKLIFLHETSLEEDLERKILELVEFGDIEVSDDKIVVYDDFVFSEYSGEDYDNILVLFIDDQVFVSWSSNYNTIMDNYVRYSYNIKL